MKFWTVTFSIQDWNCLVSDTVLLKKEIFLDLHHGTKISPLIMDKQVSKYRGLSYQDWNWLVSHTVLLRKKMFFDLHHSTKHHFSSYGQASVWIQRFINIKSVSVFSDNQESNSRNKINSFYIGSSNKTETLRLRTWSRKSNEWLWKIEGGT